MLDKPAPKKKKKKNASRQLSAMPERMLLHAPYTAFTADDNRALNATPASVGALAAQAAALQSEETRLSRQLRQLLQQRRRSARQ